MLTVETKEIVSALKNAQKTAWMRGTKPILSCARLVVDDGELVIESTNLEVTSMTRIPAAGCLDVSCVPIDQALLRLKPVKADRVELSRDNGSLIFSAGPSRGMAHVLDPADFPSVATDDTTDWQRVLTISGDKLRRALPAALRAVAKESTRYAINGIHLIAGDHEESGHYTTNKKSALSATDGRRLVTIDLCAPADAPCSAILPTAGIRAVIACLGKRKRNQADTTVEISAHRNSVAFSDRDNGWSVRMVTVEGQFPRVVDVIPPKKQLHTWLADPAEFLAAVKVAQAATNEESKGIRLDFAAIGGCVVSGRAPGQGDASAEVGIGGNGRKLAFGINPAFLVDALETTPVNDVGGIVFSANEPNRPCTIGDGTDTFWVIMPVSLT